MIGLLKKDFYMSYCTNPIWVIFILVYTACGALTDNIFFLSFSMLMSALLVNSAIASDEQSKWEPYVLALPVSRMQLVLSRYLFGVINVVMFGGIILMTVVIGDLLGVVAAAGKLAFLPVLFGAGLLMMAVQFPFVIRYGATKGRVASMLVVFAVMATTGGLTAAMENDRIVQSIQYASWLLWVAPLIGLAALLISLAVSLVLVEKKNY